MNVKLVTLEGEFIHGQTISLKEKIPDIIIWKAKYYKFQISQTDKNHEKHYVYYEAFAYVLV